MHLRPNQFVFKKKKRNEHTKDKDRRKTKKPDNFGRKLLPTILKY